MALRNLTIGNSDFERMRLNNRLYVDKTHFVPMLRSKGEFYFLSRPRRFGKTMFLEMMRAYFQGRRELFKDLALDHYPHWDIYPVFYFDFSNVALRHTLNDADLYLRDQLKEMARQNGFKLKKMPAHEDLFRQLLLRSYEKHGKKAVILVDEYDKPLIDRLHKPEEVRAFHEYLSSFYSILKPQAEHIEFLFITGITRFEKLNIFSGLNQLHDITFDRDFHAIAGFTEAEIRKYYGEYIQKVSVGDEKEKIPPRTEAEVMEELAHWYNGYQWVIGEDKIYNPISVMYALDSGHFQDYWIETGQQSRFLMNYIQQYGFDPTILTSPIEKEKGLLSAMSYQKPEALTLLWQAGYLTIKDVRYQDGDCYYTLGIPNFEIKKTIKDSLLTGLFYQEGMRPTGNTPNVLLENWRDGFVRALSEGDPGRVLNYWNRILVLIPYYQYAQVEQKAIDEKSTTLIEAFYHVNFLLCCLLCGYEPESERAICNGRLDLALSLKDYHWIFEFKHSKDGDGKKLAATALAQIYDRGYHQPYLHQGKKVILVGLGIINRQAYQVSEMME